MSSVEQRKCLRYPMLHKIASNSPVVMDVFSPDDRAMDIKDLNLFTDDLLLQFNLGVSWNITADIFHSKL